MKTTLLLGILFFSCTNNFCQVYQVADDSINITVKVVDAKDSIEGYKITIINRASTNMFLCKPKFRKFPVYINAIDGPLILGCSCEYGFIQDIGNGVKEVEVIKIASRDTLQFELRQFGISGKKISKKEFIRKYKIITFDYVVSASLLLFTRSENIYREFETYKRRIVVSISN